MKSFLNIDSTVQVSLKHDFMHTCVFILTLLKVKISGADLGLNHCCFSCGSPHITHIHTHVVHLHTNTHTAVMKMPTVKSNRSVVVNTFTSDCFFWILDGAMLTVLTLYVQFEGFFVLFLPLTLIGSLKFSCSLLFC